MLDLSKSDVQMYIHMIVLYSERWTWTISGTYCYSLRSVTMVVFVDMSRYTTLVSEAIFVPIQTAIPNVLFSYQYKVLFGFHEKKSFLLCQRYHSQIQLADFFQYSCQKIFNSFWTKSSSMMYIQKPRKVSFEKRSMSVYLWL